VIRSERLIKLGDSWFSAKSIKVERHGICYRGKVIYARRSLAFLKAA